MSRYRLRPTDTQEAALLAHCSHARYVWNLAVEQYTYWRPDRTAPPTYIEQSRQLTRARAAFAWLGAGSVIVQQQALRDFHQAMRNFFVGTHRRPTWRKAGRHESFRVVGAGASRIQQLNGRWSRVLVPKVGWVRFHRSRPIPAARSYRVTRDRAGRWHIAFAAIPVPVSGPGTDTIVGIDRGITVTLALSDGTSYQVPDQAARDRRIQRVQRRLARAKRGSGRRRKLKAQLARLHVHNADARKDWVEQTSTHIARRYDLIRIEDLRVAGMTRSARRTVAQPGRKVAAKAGLNRSIMRQGWSLFAARLADKAAGRVELVDPAYTSQRCSACGHLAAESRKSQALFVCVACTYTGNADVNAARNIAAGHAVTARGGRPSGQPANREPQFGASSAA